MTTTISPKQAAAEAALSYVEDGMILGLGTGSTAKLFIDGLAAKQREGVQVKGIPTSEASRQQAEALGIELIEPDETTVIDIAIDGADEIDRNGHLIKGGGGALLREKIIDGAANRFIVIADASKDVGTLGAFPLPIEIDRFGWALTVSAIRGVLAVHGFTNIDLQLRQGAPGEGTFLSDGGHYVLDAPLGRIDDPAGLDTALTMVPGVVTTGLFVGLAHTLIIGTERGAEIRDV